MDFKLFSLLAICTVAIFPTSVISYLFTDGDKIYLNDKWLVEKLEGSTSYGEENGKLYGCKVDRELNTDEKIQAKEARLKFEDSMVQMTDDLNKDITKMNRKMIRGNKQDVSKMKRLLARDLAKMNKKMKQDAYRYKIKVQKDIAKMNQQLARDMAKMNQDIELDLNPYKGRKNIKKNKRKRRVTVNQNTYEDMNYDADEDMNPKMGQYTNAKKGRKNRKRNKNAYKKQGMVRNGIIGNNNDNVLNRNNVVHTNSDNGFNMDSLDSDIQNNVSKMNDDYLEGEMGAKKSRKNNKNKKRPANTKVVKTTNGIYDNKSDNHNVVTSISDVNSNNDSNNVGNTVIVNTEQDMDHNMAKTNQYIGQNSGKTYTHVVNTNEVIADNPIIGDNMQNVVNYNNLDNSNINEAGKGVDNIVSISNDVNNNNNGVVKVVGNGVNTVDDVNSINSVGTVIVDSKQSMNPETDQNMAEINDGGDVEGNVYTYKTGKSNKIRRGQASTKRFIVKKSSDKGNIVKNNNVVETINDVNINTTGNDSGNAVIVDPDQNMNKMNDGYVQEDIHNKNSKQIFKKNKGMAKKERVIITKDNTGNNYSVNDMDVYDSGPVPF